MATTRAHSEILKAASTRKPSGMDLFILYQMVRYRGAEVSMRPLAPEADEVRTAVEAAFARADGEAKRNFWIRLLCEGRADEHPVALNGERLDAGPYPPDDLVRDMLNEDWLGYLDADAVREHLDEARDVLERAADAVATAYVDESLAATYRAAAAALPGVRELVSAGVPGDSLRAAAVAERVAADFARPASADDLTAGLADALASWMRANRGVALTGRAVRELRRGAGLTQEQMAEAVGITSQHLSRVESKDGPVPSDLGTRVIGVCEGRKGSGRGFQ